MNDQPSPTQEELLAMAEAAYAAESERPSLPLREEELPAPDPALQPQETVEEEPAATSEDKPPVYLKTSSLFTVLGIALGLILGATAGFLTGKIPLCLICGVGLGLATGILLDKRTDQTDTTKENTIDE